jgi:hypothetical protein
MNSPRVIYLPRRLEPVETDPFLDRGPAAVLALRPAPEPQTKAVPRPPLRAA